MLIKACQDLVWNHDTSIPHHKKWQEKIILKSTLLRDTSVERQQARKTGKSPSGKEDRPPRFCFQERRISNDRDCDYWHLPHCRSFKQGTCRLRKDCPSVHQKRKDRTETLPQNDDMLEKGTSTIAPVEENRQRERKPCGYSHDCQTATSSKWSNPVNI